MNNKLLIAILSGALPFILVWVGFILTGFSYNPREVFQDGAFWGISIIYWFLWICMIGFILDMIEEDNKISHQLKNK